jgi:hypothetical protein
MGTFLFVDEIQTTRSRLHLGLLLGLFHHKYAQCAPRREKQAFRKWEKPAVMNQVAPVAPAAPVVLVGAHARKGGTEQKSSIIQPLNPGFPRRMTGSFQRRPWLPYRQT